ncbi:hypothetical protein JG688_00012832 [Phytophthora aleatoria]|uniref:Histone H4 n=1 Tax=Phytophthora aleatoria TaxID=2496075 RepID=A0A8J5LZH6_9STRA|nr:hypothetical protein JG688_00012832 [Phytophthora aleatoria]
MYIGISTRFPPSRSSCWSHTHVCIGPRSSSRRPQGVCHKPGARRRSLHGARKPKTVTPMDVVYALKRQGRTLYGFGG